MWTKQQTDQTNTHTDINANKHMKIYSWTNLQTVRLVRTDKHGLTDLQYDEHTERYR